MSPELSHEKASAIENQQAGIFEKINNAARTRLAIAGIALASAVGVAELSRSSDANAADPVPEVTASSLKQECIEAGQKRPEFMSASISGPKKFGLRYYSYKFNYEPMPEQCNGEFIQTAAVRFNVQDSKHPSRWKRGFLNDVFFGNEAGGIINNTATLKSQKNEHPYKCIPGPKKAGVRMELKQFVLKDEPIEIAEERGYKLIAQKTVINRTVKVRGAC